MVKKRNTWLEELLSIILLACLITSCSGQSSKEDSRRVVQSHKSEEAQGAWIDQLFYIDGQLCQHLRAIYQDSKGNLWMGTNNYNIMFFNGDSLAFVDMGDDINFGRITGIVEDDQGNIWLGHYNGLTKFDPSLAEDNMTDAFTHYSSDDGMVDNEVWTLMRDKKGILWIGTMEGVTQFDGKRFTTFEVPKAVLENVEPILSENRITTIMEAKDGRIWIGIDGHGITVYDPSEFERYAFSFLTKDSGLVDNNIAQVMQDRAGNIWIGSMFGGMSIYDGKTFRHITQEGLVDGMETYSLHEDRAGNIWFSAEHQGIYKFDPTLPSISRESFTNYYKDDGLNTGGVICIYEDTNNRFWIGGWGGLFRFYGDSIVSVTKNGPWD